MRNALFCGAAALALCAAGAGDEQSPRQRMSAPAERGGGWTTDVYLLASQRVLADTPRIEAGGYVVPAAASAAVEWLTAEDVPEDLRRRALAVATIIELEIDPVGRIAACNVLLASSEPRLAQLACRLARERLRPRPLYKGPGEPAASRWQMSMAWQTWRPGSGEPTFRPPPPAPPAPPAPPVPPAARPRAVAMIEPWPRLDWPGHVTVASLPPIQGMFPANARRREGRASLDLMFTAEEGITACTVREGSGDVALDEAACRIARALELRYLWPCEYCTQSPLPLQFVWNRRGGSHIRLPLMPRRYSADWPDPPRDPADGRTARRLEAPRDRQRFTFTAADFARVADRTMRRKVVWAELIVSPQGRATRCMLRSTGNRAIDIRSCRLVMSRRHPIRTDVFGDPAEARTAVEIDLRGVE